MPSGLAAISRAIRALFIGAVRVYQMTLSPYLGGNCRFYPSCSHYAIMAIRKDGAVRGSLKSIWRILRCNPFSRGGIDYP
jgi:uncharacterized protein